MTFGQVAFIAIALMLAGMMGFAIQRGATCTVAAMDEIVNKRRAHRLTSMLEASLWVAGGVLIARALNLSTIMPAGYATTGMTVLGGALLGLGAYVNQACVFGAIARLGSGEWAYVLTPVGFYVGCATVSAWSAIPNAAHSAEVSPVLRASMWLALPALVFMLWRVGLPLMGLRGVSTQPLLQRLRIEIAPRVWAPHAATGVIGITFFFLLLMMGAWAYTDVLAELAQGMRGNLFVRMLLLLALLAGAMLGGWTAGRFRRIPLSPRQLAQCFVGGVLMGWGSLLIPGSNDGLILLGMPLLWPYAWVAFLAMCMTIAAVMLTRKRLTEK